MRKDGELWVLRLLRKPPRAQGKRWSLDIVIIFFLSFVHQIRDRIFVYHVTIISYLYPIFNHIMSLPYNTHQTGPYRSLIVGDLFSLQNEYGSLDIYIYIYIYIYKGFFFWRSQNEIYNCYKTTRTKPRKETKSAYARTQQRA